MGSQPSSFTNEKTLKFVFTLAIGLPNRFDSQYLTLTIQGLRASVNITNAGGAIMPHMYAQIYGMTAEDMYSLTTVYWSPDGYIEAAATQNPDLWNVVAVYAIDGDQENLVFSGNIVQAWGIYSGMPEVYLNLEAQGWYFLQITPAPRTVITSNTTIASVMEQLANKMGVIFEDNGVVGTVRAGQTLNGSYKEQIDAMASQYRNQLVVWPDVTSASTVTWGTLAIAPPYVPRNYNAPLISATTGLIGYPIYQGFGVLLDTFFNPAIKFGGPIEIQSAIPKASGKWQVALMTHTLESEMPNGQWKTSIVANNTGFLAAQ